MEKYHIENINIGLLKPHEQTQPDHLEKLRIEIERDGCLKNPIIVDQKTLVILDGHHRWNSLKLLGARFCPCCLVDYASDKIGVACWRPGEVVSKEKVIQAGISGKLLVPKTSRHLIPDRPEGINTPLADLK